MLVGAAVFVGIPIALGFERDLMWLERQLVEPDEFVLVRNRYRPDRWAFPARVAFSFVVYGAGVALYWLVGRWVFNRAVGRFARSRDATA